MIGKFLFLSVLLAGQALAYIPTVESLLRNGNNIDIGSNTIIANLKIKKTFSGTNASESSAMMSMRLADQVIKLYISNESESEPKLVQVNFAATQIKDEEITSVIYRPNFEHGRLGFEEENVLGKMFYAVMSNVLNNDGKMLVQFLQKYGVPVKLNAELINRDKLNLLRRYSEYLKLNGSDENLKNPLKSDDPDKQLELTALLNSPFYLKSPFVTKVREGEDFFWLIKTSNFEAKIVDETRQLRYLKFDGPYGEIKFLFDNYLISGSNFEVPKKITIFDTNKDVYEVEITRIQVVAEKGGSYESRFKDFLEAKNQNNLRRTPKPPFLL